MSRASSPPLMAGLHALAAMAAVTFALLCATPANAQALTNTFGGLSESSDQPIDIESDTLVVHDKDRYATFEGNVKVVQGSTVLQASQLNVHLAGDKPAAKKQDGSEQTAPKSPDAKDVKENSAAGDREPENSKMLGISKDPMDIESDLLVVHDKEKYATFKGNVKAVQGTSTLSAGELTVNYTGGDRFASASEATKAIDVEGMAGGGDAQITKLEAKGNVVITSKKDGGNNMLKGERLVIDLKTNEASFESAGDAEAGNRVRALFNSKDAMGATSAAPKPGEPEPRDGETEPPTAAAENTIPSGNKSDASGDKSDGVTAGNEAPDAGRDRLKSADKVTKIEAKGNVVITSGKDQTTTSDWALYDLASQMVTVGGNVVLTQGQNVLNGNRLLIDLKTGESRFENIGDTVSGGRIRGLFMPRDGGKSKGAKPAAAKPAESKTEADSSGAEPDAGTGEEPFQAGEPDDVPLLLEPKR